MAKPQAQDRHGSTASSGAESWTSQDTIRNVFNHSRRGTPVKIATDTDIRHDSEISPGSIPSSQNPPRLPKPNAVSSSITPWETQETPDFDNYRRELGAIDTGMKIPQIQRQPPSTVSPTPGQQWSNGNFVRPTSVFGSFYDDSSEDIAQLSPEFRPGSSQEEMEYATDNRRPSVASVTTVSSIGSKSSLGRGFHKKLDAFFGEEFPGVEAASRQNSESSLPPAGMLGGRINGSPSNAGGVGAVLARSRSRNNSSVNASASRPTSPASFTSRPKTPYASEVTPWEFQDHRDKLLPQPPGNATVPKITKGGHSHKLHLPGHRHTRSKDEPKTADLASGLQLRPVISREDSLSSIRTLAGPITPSGVTKASQFARPPSPTPSANSLNMSMNPRSPHSGMKRSLFDKIRGPHRKEKERAESLRDLGPSTSSLQSAKGKLQQRLEPSQATTKKRASPNTAPRAAVSSNTKDVAKGRLPFMSKKNDPLPVLRRDPNEVNPNSTASNAVWELDTDFSDMKDIIATKRSMPPPVTGEIYAGPEPNQRLSRIEPKVVDNTNGGAWDAPDSWAVKKPGEENLGRMPELDDNGRPLEEATGPPYCLRIFRSDSTFAVLSVPLNTTVSDIIELIRKKSFLQDDLDNYLIVMKKHDISRQLERNERPLVIQRKLLEQAGYAVADKIEDVGREDNSYLCRFTFLPQKSSGYASIEKDPELEKQTKFSHVDLQGKNLVTIPVALHKRATEIISINLSRNLSIDVPKDFIQACTNLREIKFTSNEAWKVPLSFNQASRLTMLDMSNNQLEQLDHAELHKLHNLSSLRLSNNILTKLPQHFGEYKYLRSLNLSSNSLAEFPEQLAEIASLVDLDISFNAIASLPDIGKLTSLERLWATNNKLSGSFPQSTSNLHNLREMDIRHNALDNIDVLSQLPRLEYLMVGYNNISAFEGTFPKIRVLALNHNPVTRFGIATPLPTLTSLNIEKAKLAALPDDLFQRIPNLIKLILDKNHFVSLSPNIGKLTRLEHLSIAQNALSSLPPEIGRLVELRFLDLRENNLNSLPPQLWFARRLETLNVSSNVLGSFPRPGAPMPAPPETLGSTPTEGIGMIPEDEIGRLSDIAMRRPSTTSGYLSAGSSSPGTQSRKGSMASQFTIPRKPSMVSRGSESTLATLTPVSRKDSTLSNRLLTTFAGSLRHLYLAENRLNDEVFDELALLPELRIINMSHNELYELPPRTLRRWPHLDELYLSGNDLSSLPSEDLDEVSSLRVLHINSNKFQVLPAELAKVQKLAIMDVGSNLLKYNVSNWPYDWNWNWNHQLKYLNMSGNKRLEIKPSGSLASGRGGKDLTDFTSLTKLRVLGLMDVTLRSTVPDQTEDRRVRTAGSQAGHMSYGMADALGKNEHLSTMDMVVDRFRSHDDEVLVGMFDGQALSEGGSKIAKYLYENFKHKFADELEKLRNPETASDALRRTYLALNKDIAIAVTQTQEQKREASPTPRSVSSVPDLNEQDLTSGCVATVLFVKDMDLFISNVGDATALIIDSEGGHKVVTRRHDPTEPSERQRVREAGGYVSRNGKLNDILEVSRAFGYVQHSPAVIAAPYVSQISITESHEMILIASRELWQYMSRDFAVDIARSERDDLMRAAQKLRDLAIAFGATTKLMVMLIGISDLRRRERLQVRTHAMGMSPSGLIDDFPAWRRGKRDKNLVADSRLARLDQEVEAPTGQISLVFTDIKNSTLLWETYPIAMRSAIKMHNELMRRQLRIIGGFEVKTEGDAFMVAFPTVTSALLWAFTTQIQLLDVPWPSEILNSVNGQEVCDGDGNVIFRGLSVRMGIHWGAPVCETDPVTKRMDYFGPMVNRSSRISSVADGGQITVSADFIAEIQRLLETHMESDRNGSTGSEEAMMAADDPISQQIRRELRSLSSQGFEVKDLGERRLKGLENPEYIYLMYPHALSSRLLVQQQRAEAEAARTNAGSAGVKTADSTLAIDVANVWDLCAIALRMEALCSSLENPSCTGLKAPETAFLERVKEGGGEIPDGFLLNIVEHQVSRIETCITTLTLRNMVRPFKNGISNQACPMGDVLAELAGQLRELQELKTAVSGGDVEAADAGDVSKHGAEMSNSMFMV